MSLQRVADDGRLAGRARRRVDARHPLARHREQAERIVVAQVALDRERKLRQVGERLQVARDGRPWRRTPAGSARRCRRRAAGSSAALELQRLQLVAAGALDRLELAGQGSLAMSSRLLGAATGRTVRSSRPCERPRTRATRAPALVGDDDVVDAGAAGCARSRRASAVSTSPRCDRREEVDRQAGGDGDDVARVAGEGERRVGERGDEAAVADVVAVQHVVAHGHLRRGACRRRRATIACRAPCDARSAANMCAPTAAGARAACGARRAIGSAVGEDRRRAWP